jgi:hypothetical protein
LESPFDISCQGPQVAVMAVRIFMGFLLLHTEDGLLLGWKKHQERE